jgi:heterodisulfide reductase subunit B
MKFTLFLGCNIPARVPQYQEAAAAVCSRLDIQIQTVDRFMCCGYPMRNIDEFVFLVSAARNLAIAEKKNQDLMVLCKCCYGSLKMAQFQLNENQSLLERVNSVLEKEDLFYSGAAVIHHFLSILHQDSNQKKIKELIQTKFKKLNIAASVGCHALRPAKITQFDTPATPTVFDDLVKLTGAKSIQWSKKSECCGAPLLGINDALSKNIMEKKLDNAKDAGAHFISVACPYSFLQFDEIQSRVAKEKEDMGTLGAVLYPQLLGLAMGIDSKKLGLDQHQIDITTLASFLSAEDDKKKEKKGKKKE